MKKFWNQSGITLVELLAALALIGVVVAIAGSLLGQLFQSNDHVQRDLDLKQQANTILMSIKEQSEDHPVNICLENPSTLTVNNGSNIITKENLTISELYIEKKENTPQPISKDLLTDSCETVGDFDKQIFLTVEIDEVKYKTSALLLAQDPTDVMIEIGGDDVQTDPQDPGDPDLEPSEECKPLESKQQSTMEGDRNCPEHVSIPTNATHTIVGSATFENGLTIGTNASLQIKGAGTFYGSTELRNGAKLYVSGPTVFTGDLTLKNGASLWSKDTNVSGLDDMKFHNKSEFTVNGSLTFGEHTNIKAVGNKITICVTGEVINPPTTLTIQSGNCQSPPES
ncbi:prepilin-type N-terminal cleavage/methylation domain-containing protein [Halobacillus fulvus]|nr:prepilin-type N-terminal cleavage/methylation domain-containing protein [Halobacillus fulvus]